MVFSGQREAQQGAAVAAAAVVVVGEGYTQQPELLQTEEPIAEEVKEVDHILPVVDKVP